MLRLLPLVLLIAPFAPALAQEPDSVAAHRYLPLDVGSHWQYELWIEECDPEIPYNCWDTKKGYLDRLVKGDSLLDGVRYQEVRDMRFNPDHQHQNTAFHLVRFDTTEARAYRLQTGPRGTSSSELPWPDTDFTCPLNLSEGMHSCDGSAYWDYADVSTAYPSYLAGAVVDLQSKAYEGLHCYIAFVADVGMQGLSCLEFGGYFDVLVYANVHGIEYGQQQPLSGELPGEATATALELFPNPAIGRVTARFSLGEAQAAVLAVFDVLGRRVLERDLGPLAGGEHEVRLEIRSLPAGLYIVRLTGDAGARATVQFTRTGG